ncbi:MAG: site-2 protease family protein [Candidatus Marsarchaeota archaeon]|nr:site-2 protease family protein [Candidatus Marsarchaeota archaeon]
MVEISPTIGRIFGIDVQIHWTLILLLLFSLINSLFFVIILLLWVCVFVHELSHSIIALKNNVKVKKIVLNLLGGASIIDTSSIKPETEFQISIIGPITSIAIGLGFGLALVYMNGGVIKEIFQNMFLLNMLLGVLNLLPAFPLDGGRVFRSYLERKNNFLSATQTTAKATNVIAFLIIIGSIAYVSMISSSFVYKEFFVFWDIIVAMFLYSGSQAELQAAYIKKYASHLHVRDALSRNFILLSHPVTLQRVYAEVLRRHTHIVLIKKGKDIFLISKFKGLANKKKVDLIKSLSVQIPSIDYNAPLSKVIDLMASTQKGVIAVSRAGRIVGVLLDSHVESIISLQMSKQAAAESAIPQNVAKTNNFKGSHTK